MKDKQFFSELKNFDKKLIDENFGIWLFLADCIFFMDQLIKIYPKGIFDMIFADPPYKMLNLDKENNLISFAFIRFFINKNFSK